MCLYRVLVCGESKAKDCISKIMVATITKSVQTHYSGTGRMVNNVGKKNFSATATFGCLKGKFQFLTFNIIYQVLCLHFVNSVIFVVDTLVEKFGDNNEVKGLEGKVGRWLSGAGDRDGGRANRKKGDIQNE